MRLKFEVLVELEREHGKFSTKDSLADDIQECIDNADPGTVHGDGEEATYNIVDWEVTRVA